MSNLLRRLQLGERPKERDFVNPDGTVTPRRQAYQEMSALYHNNQLISTDEGFAFWDPLEEPEQPKSKSRINLARLVRTIAEAEPDSREFLLKFLLKLSENGIMPDSPDTAETAQVLSQIIEGMTTTPIPESRKTVHTRKLFGLIPFGTGTETIYVPNFTPPIEGAGIRVTVTPGLLNGLSRLIGKKK